MCVASQDQDERNDELEEVGKSDEALESLLKANLIPPYLLLLLALSELPVKTIQSDNERHRSIEVTISLKQTPTWTSERLQSATPEITT